MCILVAVNGGRGTSGGRGRESKLEVFLAADVIETLGTFEVRQTVAGRAVGRGLPHSHCRAALCASQVRPI